MSSADGPGARDDRARAPAGTARPTSVHAFASHAPRRASDPRAAAPAGLVIRTAEPADVDRVAALVAERDGGDVPTHFAGLTRELARIRDGADVAVWVAVLDAAIVGYARALRFVRPSEAPPDTAPDGWYLTGVIVDPAHRRRGIGEAATRARLAWLATRTDVVRYFANERNGATIDLHARLGFREVTRRFTYPGVTFAGGTGILFERRRSTGGDASHA